MLRSGRLPLWNPMAGCGAPHLANGQSAVFDPFHADRLPRPPARRPRLDGGGPALVRGPGDVPAGPGLGLRAAGAGGSRAWRSRSAGSWSSGSCSRSRTSPSGCPGSCWRPSGVWDRPGPRTVGWLALAVGGTLAGRARPDERPCPARGRRRIRPGEAGGADRRAGARSAWIAGRGAGRGDRGGRGRAARVSTWPGARSGATATASGPRPGSWPGPGSSTPPAPPCPRSTGASGGASPTWRRRWGSTT